MGFTDWDYGGYIGVPRRGSPRFPSPTQRTVSFTVSLPTDRSVTPEEAAHARVALEAQAVDYLDRHGLLGLDFRWETTAPLESSRGPAITLEVRTDHRTDGEWPAIRRAIAEDEADRAAAKSMPAPIEWVPADDGAAAASVVDDRLDALARGARFWADPSYR